MVSRLLKINKTDDDIDTKTPPLLVTTYKKGNILLRYLLVTRYSYIISQQ